jgi:hypothetical protein
MRRARRRKEGKIKGEEDEKDRLSMIKKRKRRRRSLIYLQRRR